MYETQLKTSQFGDTGLEITRVGFGAWAIGGGGWEFGWGPQQDEESIAAIHRAVDLGRSPGRCGILRRTARSPDSADPARWTLSWPRRASRSPTRTPAEEMGYARRDIAALFEVLARTAEAPGTITGPARSDMAEPGNGS